ncbi:hypothetical protein [Bacillus licheniformis]|uniref:response regulator aspartate phosphatase n=1 Tax=Bacillus licheniformis TaxID=1402 RepID=UPI0030C8D2C7
MRGHVSMRRYDDGIPYDIVTRKLNDWYTAIRNNLDKEATSLKKEVEKFIGRVDKNSDVFFIISF